MPGPPDDATGELPAVGPGVPPGAHRTAKPERSRRLKWARRVLFSFAALIILLAAVVGASYLDVLHDLGKDSHFSTKQTKDLTPPPPSGPENILMIGSDSRQCIPKSQYKHDGNPLVQSGQRSDVIIIVRLVPATTSVEMLSIPRDTYVPIAGTGGSALINSAFNTGPDQLIQTIQQDFGIPINHVAQVNFCGFTKIVNDLGGIYLDFPYPATDAYTGLRILHAGCQMVNGTQALELVRSRHYYYYPGGSIGPELGYDTGLFTGGVYDEQSDWSRIQRQQAFFHAVLDRVRADDLDLFKMHSLLSDVASNLTVDQGLSSTALISIAWTYRHFSSSELKTLVLPTYEGDFGGAPGIAPAEPQAAQVISEFMSFGAQPAGGSTTTTTTTSTTVAPSGSSTSSTTTSTTSPSLTTSTDVPTTTSPLNEVVTDTPQSLPEPWNPHPCSP